MEREADGAKMEATFWVMELNKTDEEGDPIFIMMYSQNVILDFFVSPQNPYELIRWPHVSINTLRRVPMKRGRMRLKRTSPRTPHNKVTRETQPSGWVFFFQFGQHRRCIFQYRFRGRSEWLGMMSLN